MLDGDRPIAIDFHTHAEEPCGLRPDDGFGELQRAMAADRRAPLTHPPTIPETAAHRLRHLPGRRRA